jgi:hypothetical protein
MSSNKKFTFPIDKASFNNKADLYHYIETKYGFMLNDDMSAKRLYFNLKNGKTEGKCVISGKPTKFNEVTERYERFFSNKEKEEYREEFKARMMNKYGKVHLLDNPEQQKEMLNNRKITTEYTWRDGSITNVTGDYEYNFLEYIEAAYNFKAEYLMEPPTFYYTDGQNTRFYLPDFCIPSLNLIIEIKGSNNHYQKRDEYKEKLKAAAVKKAGFNFIQINDKDYTIFNIYFKINVLDK